MLGASFRIPLSHGFTALPASPILPSQVRRNATICSCARHPAIARATRNQFPTAVRVPRFQLSPKAARKPLVAAQHRSRAANDAGENRQTCFSRHLERAHIKSGKARPAREGAFRKEDKEAAAARQVDQPLGVCKAAGNVIALDKRYAQPPQKGTGHSLRRQSRAWRRSPARRGEPWPIRARPCSWSD